MQKHTWTKAEREIPTWMFDADPAYQVEKVGMGSYAAYYGTERIGELCGTRAEAVTAAELLYDSPEMRSQRAMALIFKYGDTDGADHKQWVLDQVLRTLSGGAGHLADPGIAP